MAQVQGLLTGGREMSPVTIMCLSILRGQDEWDRMQAKIDTEVLAVRTALLNRDPSQAERLFPEYFIPTPEDAAKALEERVEQDEGTPEVAEDIERWLAQNGGGTISGADLGDNGGWE